MENMDITQVYWATFKINTLKFLDPTLPLLLQTFTAMHYNIKNVGLQSQRNCNEILCVLIQMIHKHTNVGWKN